MTKVVGFKVLKGVSKKTGKEFDGVVYYIVDEKPQDDSVIGQTVLEQYVNGDMSRKAVAKFGGDYSKVLGKAVRLSYQRGTTYLDSLEID